MGIHGLSYYIKSFSSLVENIQWKIDSKQTSDHFIVDGNAFVYHIAFENRTNWTHGGQYATIAEAVTKTIHTLSKAGIQLTFLFDGALPNDKIETRIKRHRSYIERCVSTFHNLGQINTSNKNAQERQNGIQYYGDLFLIPPLTLEVVVQTLRELKVQVKICQAEADGEVVLMAIEQDAYVVSQDSDMHVYPKIGKGYIPFDMLNIPQDGSFVSAGVYHPQRLASMLNLEPCLLPLFGTLLGNDYLDTDVVRAPIGQWCSTHGIPTTKSPTGWPKLVAEFIKRNTQEPNGVIWAIAEQLKPIISKSSFKSRQEIAHHFQDRIIESISRYDDKSPLLLKKQNQQITRYGLIDTLYAASKYHRKGFSRQLLDIMESRTCWTSIFLEDIEREYSWDVSRALRQYVYGAILAKSGQLLTFSIDEYVREKQHLEAIQVKGTSLQDFYAAHASSQEMLAQFDVSVHPFILCLRYMIHHCSQSIPQGGRLLNYEVVGIVISTLRSLAPKIGFPEHQTTMPSVPSLKKRSVHLASQFQSIVYSSYLLSQILDMPDYLQLPGVLAHLYHGTYFHYYIDLARNGASIGKMLLGTSDKFKLFFCSVYKAVMADLEQDVQPVFDYRLEQQNLLDQKPKRLHSNPHEPVKKKKKKHTVSKVNTKNTNAFNVLSFGCTFDE